MRVRALLFSRLIGSRRDRPPHLAVRRQQSHDRRERPASRSRFMIQRCPLQSDIARRKHQHVRTEKLIPVLTIDGPSGSGKGTDQSRGRRCARLASAGFGRAVPSGRLCGGHGTGSTLRIRRRSRAAPRQPASTFVTASMVASPRLVDGHDATDDIRDRDLRCGSFGDCGNSEPCAMRCLTSNTLPPLPGFVADGRDMGTVVFRRCGVQGVPDSKRR